MSNRTIKRTFPLKTLLLLEELIGHRILLFTAPAEENVGMFISDDFHIGFYTRNTKMLMLTEKANKVTVWEWSNQPNIDTWYGDFGFLNFKKTKESPSLKFFKGSSKSLYAKNFSSSSGLSFNDYINKITILGSEGEFKREDSEGEFVLDVNLDLIIQINFVSGRIATIDGSKRDYGVGVHFFRNINSLSKDNLLKERNVFSLYESTSR